MNSNPNTSGLRPNGPLYDHSKFYSISAIGALINNKNTGKVRELLKAGGIKPTKSFVMGYESYALYPKKAVDTWAEAHNSTRRKYGPRNDAPTDRNGHKVDTNVAVVHKSAALVAPSAKAGPADATAGLPAMAVVAHAMSELVNAVGALIEEIKGLRDEHNQMLEAVTKPTPPTSNGAAAH